MSHQIFIILLCACSFGISDVNSEKCSQKWICNQSEKCVQLHKDPQNSITYTSRNACRLACGRFGALWPRPSTLPTIGKGLFNLNPRDFKFIGSEPKSIRDNVDKMIFIFLSKITHECGDDCENAKSEKEISVRMNIQSIETDLTWNTDESYQISIVTNGDQVRVILTSVSIYGFRHALETLSQMMTSNECAPGLLVVKSARIEDRPVYRHRGLLLDTSRNFLPVSAIKRTIDGMASSKFNVFHWHITDSQSFPLEIPFMPQFTIYGAYSAEQVYTPSNVSDIIQYAKDRGIRTIIELDIPSHSGNGWNWGPDYGRGELAVCVNKQPWQKYCIQPPCGQLNPVNKLVFDVLRDIYRYIISLLPIDETIHVGGDEVHLGCWNSTEEIVDYMTKHNLGREPKHFMQLWAEFHQASLRIWDEEKGQDLSSRRDTQVKPEKVIIYSSQLTDPAHIEQFLQKDRYVIQTWVETSDQMPQQLLDRGYELIMSTKNAWYFDHGFWGNTRYYSWKMAYDNRIPLHKGVLGGEACVWGELIDDNNLDSRTWPRASAVGERLWSNPGDVSSLAIERLYRHNERLHLLGMKPEPLAPKYCILNEGQCA